MDLGRWNPVSIRQNRIQSDAVVFLRQVFAYGDRWDAVLAKIDELTRGYGDREQYFVERLAQGLSRIAATWYPAPTIIRMSDFKTNEYANLLGGRQFEPDEENPMIGFRGCGRYADPAFEECFALELKAMKKEIQESRTTMEKERLFETVFLLGILLMGMA